MPIIVRIKQRTVSLTGETEGILRTYKDSLGRQEIKQVDDAEGRHSDAATGRISERQDFWSKYVTAGLELIVDSRLGAKTVELETLELYLEAPAEILLRSYVSFLNSVLVKQGLNAEDTEASEITSKYVLTRELLYRLVTISLSNKLDKEHDGDRLIIVLRAFAQQLIEKEHFISRSYFSSQVSAFLVEFAREHPVWVQQITHMVGAVKLIRSNATTISNALAYLKAVESTIQRQLAVFLDPTLTAHMLAPEWLDYTLNTCQTKLLANYKVAIPSERAIVLATKLALVEPQSRILAVLEKHFPVQHTRVAALYNLLNSTNLLYEIMSNMDLLITYTSWMPILSGMINFNKLTDLLQNHAQQCTETLFITEALGKQINDKAMRGLIKYEAMAGGSLGCFIEQTVSELNYLQDNMLKQRIGSMISSSLASLITLQAQLPAEFQFINHNSTSCAALFTNTIGASPTTSLEAEPKLLNTVSSLEAEHAKLLGEQDSLNTALTTLRQENSRLQQENIKLVDDNYIVETAVTALLHKSLLKGCTSLETLEILSDGGANVHGVCHVSGPYFGYPALHIAAATENLVACQWLLKKGAKVNSLNLQAETALDKASQKSAYAIIQLLKAQHGFSQEIKSCIRDMHAVIDAVGDKTSAVTSEQMEQLNSLRMRGVDVNGLNELTSSQFLGNRPLHTLLVKGNQKLITWFINAGADPALLDLNNKSTPYQHCCRSCNPEHVDNITAYLLQYHPGMFFEVTANNNYLLRQAAQNGQVQTMQLLLQTTANPAALDNYALCAAAAAGHTQIVRLLLQDKRVNPAAGDNYAIRVAAENGHLPVVQALLADKRVNCKARNNAAILAAMRQGHTAVVNLLKKAGAVAQPQVVANTGEPVRISATKLTEFLTQVNQHPEQTSGLLNNNPPLASLFQGSGHFLEGKTVLQRFYPGYRASVAKQKQELANVNIPGRELALQHTDAVCCIQVLPDGRLATGYQDNTIKILDSNTGNCAVTLLGHDDWVHCLQALPNNRLASGASDNTIKIWDLTSGQCQATLAGHSASIFGLQLLADNRLASCSADGTIKIWNLANQTLQTTLSGHADTVTCIQVLSGNRLASGSADKTIRIWDLTSNSYVTLAGHSNQVKCLQALPNNQLISGSRDKTIKIWNLNDSTCVHTLSGHGDTVFAVQLLANNYLASSSTDAIKIWHLNNYSCQSLANSSGYCLHACANQLASCTGPIIKLWDISALTADAQVELDRLDAAVESCKLM